MIDIAKKITATLTTAAFLFVLGISPVFASSDKQNNIHHQHEKLAKKFFVTLSGENEVPGPGDPDGTGHAKVKVRERQGKLCIHMHVENIDPATAAHVHEGPVGEAGPVVIHLPTPDANGHAHGCVDADHEKLRQIKENPSNYYVNVHNNAYPDGAVRGQLQ